MNTASETAFRWFVSVNPMFATADYVVRSVNADTGSPSSQWWSVCNADHVPIGRIRNSTAEALRRRGLKSEFGELIGNNTYQREYLFFKKA